MIDTALVPPKTVVQTKGDSPAVDIGAAHNRTFLLTLDITNIVEQEALEIFIHGSSDGATWDTKPLATIPQKFYRGETLFLLDLNPHSNVKFIRAHWETARWGRGSETPIFEFGLTIKEIPGEALCQASTEAIAV
jgi:hypothetical protein